MPDCCDPKLLQGLVRQARQNGFVYLILAECRLILPEAQAPQPDPRSGLAQQFRLLGDVASDPPRVDVGRQVRRGAPAGLLLEVDIGERVAVLVFDDEAGDVRLLNVPRRREATRQRSITRYRLAVWCMRWRWW